MAIGYKLVHKHNDKSIMLVSYVVTHILIGHVPVRPFPIGHDFPHDNAVTPDITCRGEFAVLDGFWCGPSDWYFATLFSKMQVSGWSKDHIHYFLHLPLKYQFEKYSVISRARTHSTANYLTNLRMKVDTNIDTYFRPLCIKASTVVIA